MPPIPETCSTAVNQPAPDDLINFLKCIPDGRYSRGVRHPQWVLLLVAVLGILSGCRSSRDLEASARRHREVLNEALGPDFKRWPSNATFLYLFNKAHLQAFGQALQAWMVSQIPGGAMVWISWCVMAKPCAAQPSRRKRVTTVLWPRSRSMPGPLALPLPRRPRTPTNPVSVRR